MHEQNPVSILGAKDDITMKIVDLKCPSCGGKLVPVEGNSKIVHCEYCNSQFVLEDDRVISYHIHQYQNVDPSGNFSSNKGQPSVKPVAAVIALFAFMTILIVTSILINGNKDPYHSSASATAAMEMDDYDKGQASQGSALYHAMVEAIFEKSSDSVTSEELETITYLSVQAGAEEALIMYSFENPYETGFSPQVLMLPSMEWNTSDLEVFTGLIKVDLRYWQPHFNMLEPLKNLKGVCCSQASFSELASVLPVNQIIELEVKRPEGLEGIGVFENLEILTLDQIESPDFKELVPLKQLRHLSITEENSEELTDYAPLSVLTSLETLYLDSEAIREFSFLKPLSNLTDLSVKGTEAIRIEPLAEMPQLVSLALEDNDSIADYSPLGALTGLKALTLDKSTSVPDPNLSPLNSLEDLEISGFLSISSIGNLGSLKDLSIHGCNMDEAQALSSLSGLESLTCYSVWTQEHGLKNLNFINGMPNLKRLCFCDVNADSQFGGYGNNVEIYGDISNVFNQPGLEELYLSNCIAGISFQQVKENPSLKILWIDEIRIKENFHVESYGGVTEVWYDDVSLDEHTDFLTHFPNLEELKLDGNQLTNISFAASLMNLNWLSIQDNYVTDLAPLNQVQALKYLDVRKNPVSNVPVADEGMVILK